MADTRNPYNNMPEPFFTLVIHDLSRKIGLTVADTGYECAKWHYQGITDHLFDWLIEFAMKYSELEDINSATAARMLSRAAKTVYTTEKYGKRGEFGELLLHAIIRQVFNSEPAISKIYYKSASNETVKGFDAVHVVEIDGELELWLGEVKYYKDYKKAVHDIAAEIGAHAISDYLRNEFILIAGKIDPIWPHTEKLKALISDRKSLDTVFKRICIPALITYESPIIAKHNHSSDDYYSALKMEIEPIYKLLADKSLPPVKIHFFIVPIDQKDQLTESLHRKLEGLQR